MAFAEPYLFTLFLTRELPESPNGTYEATAVFSDRDSRSAGAVVSCVYGSAFAPGGF